MNSSATRCPTTIYSNLTMGPVHTKPVFGKTAKVENEIEEVEFDLELGFESLKIDTASTDSAKKAKPNQNDSKKATHIVSEDKVKYLSFGIGSGGDGESALGKKEHSEGEAFDPVISCVEDLADFKNFAVECNSFLGSVYTNGICSLTGEAILHSISRAATLAVQANAHLVLYYTGHADMDSGDWAFGHEWVSLEQVVKAIAAVHKLHATNTCGVVILSDCCGSGMWVINAYKMGLHIGCEEYGPISVVSSCGPKMPAKDRVFAKAFWSSSLPSDKVLNNALKQQPIVSNQIGKVEGDKFRVKGYWRPDRDTAVRKWFHKR